MENSKTMIIKAKGRILFLEWNRIYLINSESNYVRIYCKSNSYRIRETLQNIAARLDGHMFMRISRSTIVNIQYIRELRSRHSLSAEVIMANNQICYWSRSYRSRLDALIDRQSLAR